MSQTEEFEKIVEAAKANKGGVVFVTGKPGSGKSKVLREAAEDKKWDYVDCRMLISEDFLAVPGSADLVCSGIPSGCGIPAPDPGPEVRARGSMARLCEG